MKPVRLGLIGCGEIAAKATVPSILKTRTVKVTAAMDVNIKLAEDLAGQTGAKHVTTCADELIANDNVDAVVISTPHYLHAPLGIKAAKKKKHVLVEKPVATTMADGRKLVAACKKNRVKLGVLYVRRYQKDTEKVRELVRKGVLGKMTGFSLISMGEKKDSYWTGGFTGRVKTDWRTKRETSGGGFLIMNFTHNIDWIQGMLGLEPKNVYAQYDTFRTPVEVEDYVSVIVRYKNSAIGTFLGSTVCPGILRVPDHIYGTHGTIVFGNPLKVFTRKKIKGLKKDDWTEIKVKANDPRAALLDNFAKAIRGKEELKLTGESGLTSLRIIEAAYKSQEQGRPVVFR